MPTPTPRQFTDALRRLESERDLEPIVALFGDDAELHSPAMDAPLRGRDGARHFWEAYRHSFDRIDSSFRHVVDGDGAALLEWSSRGSLAAGEPFEYDGVSVLEYGDGGIRRFRTYFDPAALKRRVDAAA